jgi:phosphatidylserine synthase
MSVSAVFAVAPALPLHTAGKYVAGAYIVFLAIVLIYVAIMATRLARTERELTELRRDVEARRREAMGDPDASERERERVA